MNFREIPGQLQAKTFLSGILESGKIPHAILFNGVAGRGPLPLVRAFTASLFCRNKKEGESCGECSNCKKTHQLIHPDVHFTFPVMGGKAVSSDYLQEWRELMLEVPYASLIDWQNHLDAQDKQFNINVREIAEIIEFSQLKSYQGEERVLVIWMAEFLQLEGNRLLKLIEEPPEGMYVFLIAEDRESILNTIQSRCQLLVAKPLLDNELMEHLMQEKQLPEEKARSIAFQADGNMNTALAALQKRDDSWFNNFVDWMRSCYKLQTRELIHRSQEFARLGREEQKQMFRVGLKATEAILMQQHLDREAQRIPEAQQKPIEGLASLLDASGIEDLAALLNDAIEGIQQNANSKLLFTYISQEVHRVLRRK